MNKRWLVLLWLVLASCSGNELCDPGTLGCPCLTDNTCRLDTLSCVDGTCVQPAQVCEGDRCAPPVPRCYSPCTNDLVEEDGSVRSCSQEGLLDGCIGNDLLYGGLGADLLSGGSQNDTLYGEDDRDLLRGDSGNDILVGGADSDLLFGGQGRDIFRYEQADEFGDTIFDFEIVRDRIDLSAIFNGNASLGSNVVVQQTGNNTLLMADTGDGMQQVAMLLNVNAVTIDNDNFIL